MPKRTVKAAANDIETRTLQEALETDWPEKLMMLDVGRARYRPSSREARLEIEPELVGVNEMSGNVIDGEENVPGKRGPDADPPAKEREARRVPLSEGVVLLREAADELERKSPRIEAGPSTRPVRKSAIGCINWWA